MKRKSLMLIGLMVFAGVAIGMQNAATVTSQSGNVITFKVGAQTSDTLANMIADFNALSEYDFTVDIDEGTFETDSQFDGYVSRLAAGDDTFDVFAMDVIWPPALVENDWLVDVSDIVEPSEFLEAPILAGTIDGNNYGVPWFHDSGLLYYRTDILQAAVDQGIISDATPPSTWNELKEMAINITSNSAIQTEFGTALEGFVWQGNAYEGLMCDFMEYLGGTGQTSWLDQDSNGDFYPTLNTTNVKDTLGFMNSLVDEGASPESVLTFNEEGSREVWNAGNALFHRNWPYAYRLSLDSDNLVNTTGDPQFAVAPMPAQSSAVGDAARTSCLGGWQLGINANINAESVADAKEFISWITAEEQQLTHFAGNGNLPTRPSAYNVTKLTDAGAGDQTYVVDFLPTFLKALPRPVHPDYPAMSAELWNPIAEAVAGVITPAEASQQMQTAVIEVLAGGGSGGEPQAAPFNPIWAFFGVLALGVAYRRKNN